MIFKQWEQKKSGTQTKRWSQSKFEARKAHKLENKAWGGNFLPSIGFIITLLLLGGGDPELGRGAEEGGGGGIYLRSCSYSGIQSGTIRPHYPLSGEVQRPGSGACVIKEAEIRGQTTPDRGAGRDGGLDVAKWD